MMLRIHTLAVILIVLVSGIAGVTAELSTEHSVDIADSMSIPAQAVETEWGEATITQVGKKESGENLEISADAPENKSYAVRIIDTEERNLETRFVDEGGNTETNFVLDRVDSGTYVVALTQDGGDTVVEVEPFIVKEYTVDQSVSDVMKGKSISVDIQLTSVVDDPADPQAVNVTLYGNDITRSREATKTSENLYQAEFSTEELPTGSYDIYTGIETNNNIYGYTELIGVSDSAGVSVESTKISTPIPTPTPGTNTSIDINRSISSSEVTPGGQVTVTTELTNVSESVLINSTHEPQVEMVTVQSVTVNGISVNPTRSEATVNGSTVILREIGTDAAVIVTEELTAGEKANVTHHITGDVTVGETTKEFEPVSVTVVNQTDPQQPQSIVNKYDTDNDGDISITELGQAGTDFASGKLSIIELGRVGAKFAS